MDDMKQERIRWLSVFYRCSRLFVRLETTRRVSGHWSRKARSDIGFVTKTLRFSEKTLSGCKLLPIQQCLCSFKRTSKVSLDFILTFRAVLTIRGPHTNVRQGPFSHTHARDFLSRGALFFSQKVEDLFSRQQTWTQRGKKLLVDRGPPGGGGPSHGTTGTMDNPALLTFNETFC